MSTIVPHGNIPFKKGYYSKILGRKLVTAKDGAKTCAVWEQKLPPNGYIIPHKHPFEETITFLAGKVEVIIGNQQHNLKAPTTIFIPANTMHAINNHSSTTVHLLAFLATNNPSIIYPNDPPKPVNWSTYNLQASI